MKKRQRVLVKSRRHISIIMQSSFLPVEEHPLEPFLPANAKLLMLGSFPPQKKRWSMDFFYPNLQNDMWRIFGLIFFDDKDRFLFPDKKAFDKKKLIEFLTEKASPFTIPLHQSDACRIMLRTSFWKL